MGLFGKKKNKDDEPRRDDAVDTAAHRDDGVDADETLGGSYERTADGPWDISEKFSTEAALDLGTLRVEAFDGMELRLELDQQTGDVVGITAVDGESQLQVHPYAAPRTAGVWNEIRVEIADKVREGGGTAEPEDGELGTQLDVQMPQQLPGGGTALIPMTFYGVDGPRWFVRGLLMGTAVNDAAQRERLLEWFRAITVVRGNQPLAPRTPLIMKLPAEAQAAARDELVPPIAGDTQPENSDDFTPFERGPEITEVR